MNEIYKSIQIHLAMIDLAVSSSQKIVSLSQIDDVALVEKEVENRDRLMNAVNQIQILIEREVHKLTPQDVTKVDVDILKTWFYDLAKYSESILELDQQAIALLSDQKDNTSREIAHLFKNKENFKGYGQNIKKIISLIFSFRPCW